MDNAEQFYWDPIGYIITKQTFAAEQQDLHKKFQNLREYPNFLRINLFICLSLPFIAGFLGSYSDPSIDNIVTIIYFLIYSLVPLFLYNEYVLHLQKQLILYLLCEKNNWIFKPKRNLERLQLFHSAIPQVFDHKISQDIENEIWGRPGDYDQGYDQDIEDEIWGKTIKPIITDFWAGLYTTRTSGESSTKIYSEFVLILRLPKELPANLTLKRTTLANKFKAQIKTESEEFNHAFTIVSDMVNKQEKQLIYNLLSPSVQVRILQIYNKYPVEQMIFTANIMIIVFKGGIWKSKYTNFFKKVAIDERDTTHFSEILSDITELPAEMIQFI